MSVTNPSFSDAASAAKIADAGIVGDPNPAAVITPGSGSSPVANVDVTGNVAGVPAGAIPAVTGPAPVNITSKKSSGPSDQRVKILVPDEYIRMTTRGSKNGELYNNGGIVFPYTPTISYEHKADYTDQKIMHSNYNIYFYQRSYITPITISGKFTVQNDQDAAVYLSTLHLLRALTKMQYGGTGSQFPDQQSGSPPPVCRLKGYGDFMLDNVPITISSVRVELTDTVDYYTIGNLAANRTFGQTSVPVLSTIAITCNPMYSRAEMQKFSVNGWLSGNLRKSGYL